MRMTVPSIQEKIINWWGPVLWEFYSGSERNGIFMISSPECFNIEYRCFALDNECAGIVDTDGAKMNCKIKSPNPSPYLTPVESLVEQQRAQRAGAQVAQATALAAQGV